MARRNIGERAILKLIQLVIDKFKIERQELESLIQEKVNGVKFPISNSSTITESDKFALDAIEKNASIEGTLGNQINKILSTAKFYFYNINTATSETFTIIPKDRYSKIFMFGTGLGCKTILGIVVIANESSNIKRLDFTSLGTKEILATYTSDKTGGAIVDTGTNAGVSVISSCELEIDADSYN